MKITWHIDDGYAGGSRPHTLEIPDEELEGENFHSEEERNDYIDDEVKNAFEQTCSFSWEIEE